MRIAAKWTYDIKAITVGQNIYAITVGQNIYSHSC